MPGPEVWHPIAASPGANSVAVRWTQSAYGELRRLYHFLEPVNPGGVARAVRVIVNRIERIPAQPHRLPHFGPREVRRVLAAKYEISYELMVVLRIFHAREDR